MDHKLELFIELANLFKSHGFHLYLVGGSTRDYLLNLPLSDMDVVTDATPEEEKHFLAEANYTFEKYGSIKLNYQGVKFDITTLRKEKGYLDSRHPNKIEFTRKLEEDVLRRDLSINALYLSSDLNVIDMVNGRKDLDNKILKIIGDPLTRLKEDPLRIVRIYRFQLELDFKIDKELEEVMESHLNLLKKLNINKIKEEVSKSHHQQELKTILAKAEINNL